MSLSDRQKILQQKAQQLTRPIPGNIATDPRYAERPTDVVLWQQSVMRVNIRVALMDAPLDLLYKARDQVNELINMRQNGGKNGGKN